MSEVTKDFKFVCDAYLYYRKDSEVIEEGGSIYYREPVEVMWDNGRLIPGRTIFLDKYGNTLICPDKSYVMINGKFWAPKRSIKTAKNVFRLRDSLEIAKNKEYVRKVFEDMLAEMGLTGINYNVLDIKLAYDLCDGNYDPEVVRNACGEALGYIRTIEQ